MVSLCIVLKPVPNGCLGKQGLILLQYHIAGAEVKYMDAYLCDYEENACSFSCEPVEKTARLAGHIATKEKCLVPTIPCMHSTCRR